MTGLPLPLVFMARLLGLGSGSAAQTASGTAFQQDPDSRVTSGSLWYQFGAHFLQKHFHQNLTGRASEGSDTWISFPQTCFRMIPTHVEKMFVGTGLLQGVEDLDNSIAGVLLANKVYERIWKKRWSGWCTLCVFASPDHVCFSTWDIVQELLLGLFLGFKALAVCSDLHVWSQLPIRPVGVFEHADVVHQHLFTNDHVDCVPDLSEIKQMKWRGG